MADAANTPVKMLPPGAASREAPLLRPLIELAPT